MVKRLLLSLMVLAAVSTALAFGAFAYFSDSNSGGVTITAGDVDLNLDWDDDCNNVYEVEDQDSFSITWGGIVPGDTESDCIQINNVGDGALDVYVDNSSFGPSAALRAALEFRIERKSDSHVLCNWATANAAQYTSDHGGRGCKLADELASGAFLRVVLKSKFVDDGSDQSALETLSTSWTTSVNGYTD